MTELNNGIQNGAQEVSKLMLKAVFWDMDGTLIDSEPYWHEGELKIAADHGGYWDEDLAWQGSGTPVPDVARRMVEHGCKLSIEEIGKGMIDYVAQKEFERIPWIDGVEDVLLSLKEAGAVDACHHIAASSGGKPDRAGAGRHVRRLRVR